MNEGISLPVDALIPDVLAALRSSNTLVLEAPPGAGKTTRVPRALLESNMVPGEILVLQPRRLPTRLAAARVAAELRENLGERVGYQIRFDDVGGAKTRLRFLTEGMLTRRLIAEPELPGIGAVVLDEFHERHLPADLALALLRKLQQGKRPDLRLCVMSATLEAAPIAEFLQAPQLSSEGRLFDISFEYAPAPDDRHLDQQVLSAIKRLLQTDRTGDVLVFLPGAAEIRRSMEACEDIAGRHGIELHALHGDLSAADQDRAVRPSRARKIIFSTNVAETSVTIEGVAVVIDCGLARTATHSPWTGLPALKLQKISKASARQRAGRAGRTRAGHCIRLYTQSDFEGRPDHDLPEIRRLDLAELALVIHSLGVGQLSTFEFFEAPPAAAIEAADELLLRLGAIHPSGQLTAVGTRMLQLPLHPRLARLVIEGEKLGVAKEAATVAALLAEREIRSEHRARFDDRASGAKVTSGPSDVIDVFERFSRARQNGLSRDSARGAGLDFFGAQTVERASGQLLRLARNQGPRPSSSGVEEALQRALLAAFPDRVAKRRRAREPDLLLFGGGAAQLSDRSVVQEATWLITVDAEERTGRSGQGSVTVRSASEIQPEWLLDASTKDLLDSDVLVWNAQTRRVERSTRLAYGNLVLEETTAVAPPSEAAERLLVEAVLNDPASVSGEAAAQEAWEARLELLRIAYPDAQFPADLGTLFRSAVETLCAGKRSLSELEGVSVWNALEGTLTPQQHRLMVTQTPERITLPGGRTLPVHYEKGKAPWVESRMQDFFGSQQGPTLCQGRISLVIHLLAPNQRAVQVTTDLSGFWDRHYPALRKELSRRYPRHFWPEDPRTAAPPPPRPPRR